MTDLMSDNSVYRLWPSARSHDGHGTYSNGFSGWNS